MASDRSANSEQMFFTVSSPGKILLFGEHAVVYGKAAVAVGMDLRTTVTVITCESEYVEIHMEDLALLQVKWRLTQLDDLFASIQSDPKNPVSCLPEHFDRIREFLSPVLSDMDNSQQSCCIFLFLYAHIVGTKRNFGGLRIIIKTEIPIGAGLGSSASFSVCLSAALLCAAEAVPLNFLNDDSKACLTDADKELINRWALNAEKISHANPSGVDNCISTYGGALRYQKGQYQPLKVCHQMTILAVNTLVSRNTKNMVNLVANKRKKYPDIIDPILEAIDKIAENFSRIYANATALEDDDFSTSVKDLIDMNQNLLNALGVSHERLEQVFAITKQYGLSAKLTGAGGGGFAYVFIPNDMPVEKLRSLKKDLEKGKFEYLDVVVGGPGVEISRNASLN